MTANGTLATANGTLRKMTALHNDRGRFLGSIIETGRAYYAGYLTTPKVSGGCILVLNGPDGDTIELTVTYVERLPIQLEGRRQHLLRWLRARYPWLAARWPEEHTYFIRGRRLPKTC